MLPLVVSFFATRINSTIPNYCYQSYLEGDLALNDGYLVAAVLNRNWPNKFWTISIFVDTTRGTNWLHVKDLIGTFDDGWVMDTSRYAIVDPSVSIMGDNANGFYLIGMVSLKDTSRRDSNMIVFCMAFSDPHLSGSWYCYNMHEYSPKNRDKPWVIGVLGSSRVIGAWMKEDTVFILTNDNHDAPGFEPGTSWSQTRRPARGGTTPQSTTYHARDITSGRRDLNPGPPGPKPGALPGCATPREAGLNSKDG